LTAVVVVRPHAKVCVAIHARKAGGKIVGRRKGGIVGRGEGTAVGRWREGGATEGVRCSSGGKWRGCQGVAREGGESGVGERLVRGGRRDEGG